MLVEMLVGALLFGQSRVVVKFLPDVTPRERAEFARQFGLSHKKSFRGVDVFVGGNPSMLAESPLVEYAEVDKRRAPSYIPNDPYYANWQGTLKQVKAASAWDIVMGGGPPIAILDTGVWLDHPDMRFAPGYSTVGGDVTYTHHHGVWTSGGAGAVTNNGIGVASISFGATIVPIKITNQPDGWAYESDMAEGLYWAMDRGVRIANISYGPLDSRTLLDAAAAFYNAGGLVTNAIGNEGVYTGLPDRRQFFTASAVDGWDYPASWDCFGNDNDVAYPDTCWTTIVPTGGYWYNAFGGTSLSSAQLAGLCSLVWAANPSLSNVDVETIIKQTADDKGAPGWDQDTGWGRANAFAAVSLAKTYIPVADTVPPTVSITSPPDGYQAGSSLYVVLSYGDNEGVVRAEAYVDGKLSATSNSEPFTMRVNTKRLRRGVHTLYAKVYDAAGNAGESQTISFTK